ncbi:MAG: class I SAM-dependent methyltransferase [Ignavibacteria bacterium]|nr:class I SAM-dependent methyltransferase [Ignavibacteria bacterium]
MKWGKNYISDTQRLFRIPLHPGSLEATKLIMSRIPLREGFTICDIGCGVGITLNFFANHCNCQRFGVDISFKSLRRIRNHGARLLNASAENLPFRSGVFDLIIIESVLLHCNMKSVFSEVSRIAKPGGQIAINDSFLKQNRPKGVREFLAHVQELTRVPIIPPLTLDESSHALASTHCEIEFMTDTPQADSSSSIHRAYGKFIRWKYRIKASHNLSQYLENKIIIARKIIE